ncbi:MAG: alkaline phosphatase family protein, partial [Planctomycetota bacterium]
TGKAPAKHGITWFLVDQPDGTRIPVRSTNRKTDAVWNIVDRAGLSSAVVGWWATYPAEQLRQGMIVSDAVGVHGFGSTSRDSASTGKVHPENLYGRIDSLMPVEQQVTADFAQRFMHISTEDYDRSKFDPARHARPHPMNPIHLFQQYVVTAQGYTKIAETLLEDEAFALAMLYFEQTDSFSHLFMKYDEPKLDWVDQESFERYKDLVREWYRYQDELLGRVLAKIDLETTAVILVSDHGFKIGDRRIRSDRTVDIQKAHLDHEKEGIFLAAGPHIRRNHHVEGASVIDVTPTVLHYLGLPVGKDMDGKVLNSILEPEYAAANAIVYVQTYETGQRAKSANVSMSAADARDAEAGLRQLGYIGDGEPGDAPDVAGEGESTASSPEIHNNLGRIHLGKGEVDLALAEFEKALRLDPNNAEALLNLGAVQQGRGRVRMAQHYAERALAVNPNSVGALAQLAEAKVGQMLYDDAARL